MITRVPPGIWETLSFPSSQAAGDTAYQLQIDPRLRVRGRGGRTTDATMVSPADWRQLDSVLPHHRMLPRIAPLGATKCPAFWPFGSTRPSLRDHNFATVGELELDKRQARSNAGFPGNHHARLEFGLITCLDSSWPLSFVLAPISMMAWIWGQADHRPVLRSQACAGLRDGRDLCLYLPVQHHQACAVCSWRRQRNPHQPSLLLIIQYIINIYKIYKV